MPKYTIDLTGQKFGKLTAIRPTGKRVASGELEWECLCDCGNTYFIRASSIRHGNTKSCGCYKGRYVSENAQRNGCTIDGKTTPEYTSWRKMKGRCENPKDKHYYNYGGRGITICERWQNSFENFLDDMGRKPTPLHSLDRIKGEGNYEPLNCRWATKKEQQQNTRMNVWIEYMGAKKVKAEWARNLGIPIYVLQDRLKRHTFPAMIEKFHKGFIPS